MEDWFVFHGSAGFLLHEIELASRIANIIAAEDSEVGAESRLESTLRIF